jgi:hypothetical protein
MRFITLTAAGIALVLAFVSATPKKSTDLHCKFAVSSVIEKSFGYIIIEGTEITGDVEGIDYTCQSSSSVCTVSQRCWAILQVAENRWHVPINDEYVEVQGTYTP